MVLDTRVSLVNVVQAAALLSVASCSCCNNGGDAGGPAEPQPQTDAAIASVEITPNVLAVPQGATFSLRARVKDQWGNILPDSRASVVKWATIGEVSGVSPGSGAVTTVQAATSISTTPKESYVVASVDGVEKSDSSRIVISAVPEASNRDWVAADYAVNSPPSYALLTGPSTYGEAINRVNDLTSFVKEGALENFACDPANSQCGTVTLFQPGKASTQVPLKWTSGCDYVGFTTATAPTGCSSAQPAVPALRAPWPVKVAVFTLASKAGIDNQVKADVAYAQSVFDQPQLGIALIINVTPYANKHVAITHGLACKTTEGSELTDEVAPEGVSFNPQVVTVVYVDAINPGTGDDIGFTCPFDDVHSKGTVIFVSADAINNSTLAHELGHALGQWHSGDRDHPDVPPPRLAGFDPSNLMWSSESDWGVSLRRNLTLGQLFQMSFADFSFLKKSNISAAPALKCSTDAASNSPCPPLAKDPRQ